MMRDMITLKEVKASPSRFHPKVNCKFWKERNVICPYCHSGSKAIRKDKHPEKFGGVVSSGS